MISSIIYNKQTAFTFSPIADGSLTLSAVTTHLPVMHFQKFALLTMLFGATSAHTTLNPNYGAGAGGYFKTSLKVPHGTHMKETTKIKVTVPHGYVINKPYCQTR